MSYLLLLERGFSSLDMYCPCSSMHFKRFPSWWETWVIEQIVYAVNFWWRSMSRVEILSVYFFTLLVLHFIFCSFLLGHIATLARCGSLLLQTDYRGLSVGLSVCLSVTTVSHAKAAKPIVMLFGMLTWMCPRNHVFSEVQIPHVKKMWANAQRDGRPAEYRWRPLFNATKFGWRPLLECRAVTLPRRENRWNWKGCPKLANRSRPLAARSSPYYEDMWRRYCCLTSFSDCR